MVMRHWVIAFALLSVAFSGCIASDDGGELDTAEAGPGEPAAHGTAEIVWGPVETELSTSLPFGYRAWQTATITNDFGGASRSSISLETDSGGIDVRPLAAAPPGLGAGVPGYLILATREGHGATEEQAIEAMEAVELVHEDELQGDTLRLRTALEAPTTEATSPDPTNLLGAMFLSRGGEIAAYLPEGPRHAVRATTGSGGIDVQGLRISELEADTGSGGIDVTDVSARRMVLDTGSGGIDGTDLLVDALQASTGSGGIELQGSFASIDADTGSGGIEVEARPLASGSYRFNSGSGGVDVHLDGSSRNGYDVQASTGSGGIDIDIPDGEHLDDGDDENFQHVRTRGFAGKSMQTRIDADTGSGGVVIEG